MSKSFQEKLSAYLKSGYSALYVETYEHARAEAEIVEEGSDRNRAVWRWVIDEGWTVLAGHSKNKIAPAPGPVAALEEAKNAPAGTILILQDFHQFLIMPEVYAKIKGMTNAFSGTKKTLILISCRNLIPPELEKQFTILELPLPDRDRLETVLHGVVDTAEGDKALTKGESTLLVDAALGLTTTEAEDTFSYARITTGAFKKDAVKVVQEEKAQTIKQGGLLEWWPSIDSAQHLGGMELLKKYLQESRIAFTPEAKDFGIDGLKGVLLLGPAGTGKSLAAKVASAMWEWPLFYLDMGKVFGSLVGQSEERARKACHLMETVAPCIVLMDEVDKGFSGLQSSGVTDSGVAARVMGTFLTWLQEHKSAVYCIATCNAIAGLPPELVDRFDETYFIDLPAAKERADIFGIHLQKRKRNLKHFDLQALAEGSDGYTGRDIERIVKRGLIMALEQKREITTEDLAYQTTQRTPTVKIKEKEITSMREWAKSQGVRMASALEAPKVVARKRRLDVDPSKN